MDKDQPAIEPQAISIDSPQAASGQPSGWINADGSFGDIGSAPDTIKDLISKKGYKSVEDIASSYSELNKKLSSSYRIPDELTPEITNDMLTKLGRPESSDSYTFSVEGVSYDNDTFEVFKDYAHQQGLTQSQFENLVKFDIERSNQYLENVKSASEEVLKGKYKENYEYKMSVADKMMDTLGLSDVLKSIGLYDHADVKEAMLKIADMTAESVMPDNKPQAAKSREDAIKELMSHPAMHDRLHPEHATVHKAWLDAIVNKNAR
jgi:hypothetical protein